MRPTDVDYTFDRYLAAKKSVDDRALNQTVWQALDDRLAEPTNANRVPLRVLELGAGIGTMVERMLERDLLHQAEYDAVDSQPENLRVARQRLRAWAARHDGVATTDGNRLRIWSDGGARRVDLALYAQDAFAFLGRPECAERYDLIVAHAFLDLVDVPRVLPLLQAVLRPGGLLYATINFDGATVFEPVVDAALDQQIETLYHATMDNRIIDGAPSGDSRTGRHLIHHLQAGGFDVLAAGASDWLVYARQGAYLKDEAYFLHFIVNTVDGALRDHPELNAARFDSWVEGRHLQIERGELVYLAHQVDLLAEKE
jgi:SAM-dependent methyltransferase